MASEQIKLNTTKQVFPSITSVILDAFQAFEGLGHERSIFWLLDKDHCLLERLIAGDGNIHSVETDEQAVVEAVKRTGAVYAVHGHNHPGGMVECSCPEVHIEASGSCEPSNQDYICFGYFLHLLQTLDCVLVEGLVIGGKDGKAATLRATDTLTRSDCEKLVKREIEAAKRYPGIPLAILAEIGVL